MRDATIKVTERALQNGEIAYVVDAGKLNGKRHRKQFKTQADALKYRTSLRDAKRRNGHLALLLDPKQLVDAKDALDLLAPFGISLVHAAKEYIRIAKPAGGRHTVQEVINELLTAKTASGRSTRYLKDLRLKYAAFASDFGPRNIAELRTPELDNWLAARGELTAITRSNYRRELRTLFSFAFKRGYCPTNPVLATEQPKVILPEPKALSFPEVYDLLWSAWCYRWKGNLLGYLTLGLFAGVRSAEIERMNWGHIDFKNGVVTVPAAHAKSSKRRQVEMSPNLRLWLKCCAPASTENPALHPIVTGNWRKLLQNIATELEMTPWPRNALRKSFASYHFAFHRDAGYTSSEMGHTRQDVSVFEQHYKNLVDPEHVQLFWTFAPPPPGRDEYDLWHDIYTCELPHSAAAQRDVQLVQAISAELKAQLKSHTQRIARNFANKSREPSKNPPRRKAA